MKPTIDRAKISLDLTRSKRLRDLQKKSRIPLSLCQIVSLCLDMNWASLEKELVRK